MRRGIAHLDELRADRHAREEDLLDSVYDHRVVGAQALGDDAEAIEHPPELDVATLRPVVGIEHIDVLAILVGEDRLVVQKHGRELAAARKFHAREQPRRQHPIRVVDHGAGADGADSGIESIVQKIQAPFVREALFIGQPHEHGVHRLLQGAPLAGSPPGALAQIRLLIDLEIDVNGVQRNDGGQEGRRPGSVVHQIALGDEFPADASADRGAHFREFQIELGLVDGGLRRLDGGDRLAQVLVAGVELLFGNHPLLEQPLRPRQIVFRQIAPGLSARQLSLRPSERSFIRAGIDDEQQVALLDQGSVLKIDLFQISPHASPHLYGLHGVQPSGVLFPFHDFPLNRPAYRNRRGRRSCRLCRRLAAAGEQAQEETEPACLNYPVPFVDHVLATVYLALFPGAHRQHARVLPELSTRWPVGVRYLPKADGEPVPPVDGDSRQRELDQLFVRELRARLFEDLVRGVSFADLGDRFAPGESGPFPIGIERRLAPDAERVEPLLCVAQSPRLPGVKVYAVGTAVDLGGSDLDELQQGSLETAFVRVLLQRAHRLHGVRRRFGIVQTSFRHGLLVVG